MTAKNAVYAKPRSRSSFDIYVPVQEDFSVHPYVRFQAAKGVRWVYEVGGVVSRKPKGAYQIDVGPWLLEQIELDFRHKREIFRKGDVFDDYDWKILDKELDGIVKLIGLERAMGAVS